MTPTLSRTHRPSRAFRRSVLGTLAVLALALPANVLAGSLSWVDDLVKDVVKEAEAGREGGGPVGRHRRPALRPRGRREPRGRLAAL